jgi:hypothetical protein
MENDVVLLDQYGDVYVNGQLCTPDNADTDDVTVTGSFSFGFMYFLVIISLIMGV